MKMGKTFFISQGKKEKKNAVSLSLLLLFAYLSDILHHCTIE